MSNLKNRENGEVMIESTIVMVVTLLMLVWILSVGFLYYQKYVVRIATNDLAKRVAVVYDSPNSDIIMGYVSLDEIGAKPIYFSSANKAVNQERADNYMKYMMDRANLFGTVKDVAVKVEPFGDGKDRSHIKVTTECTFNTPFGVALDYFGMNGTMTYKVTSYADSSDMQGNLSAAMTLKAFANGSIVQPPGFVKSTIDMINAFIKMAKQLGG